MVVCYKCKKQCSSTEFYKNKTRPSGLSSCCKSCAKATTVKYYKRDPMRCKASTIRWQNKNRERIATTRIKRKYGLAPEEYYTLLLTQKNACAICLQSEKQTLRGKVVELSVDHDSITGRVRGLLCNACNTGIGKLQNDFILLHRASLYLEQHS